MIPQHQKLLSYPTQKAVMQFVKADLRIKLAIHSPSLSVVDRAVPLRIHCLVLDHNITQINDTTYSLSTFREYPDGSVVPLLHREDNDNGGLDFDLDPWGLRDPSLDGVLYPGDVRLHGARNEADIDERKRELEWEREILEDEVSYGIMNPEIFANLDRLKTELLPFQCRDSKTLPNFTPYLQCTISSSEGTKSWRLQPSLKLCHAIRMLRFKLLGNHESISVKVLKIGMRRKVLRLPELIKFRVKELRILGKFSTTLNDLAPVIEPSSFPLEVLEAEFSKLEVHPDFLSVKALTVSNKSTFFFIIDDFSKLPHRIVHLKYDVFSIERFVELIENWTRTGKPIGTRFSFKIGHGTKIRELFRELSEELFESLQFDFEPKIEDYGMSIPISNSSVIRIFTHQEGEGIILVFEVVQA